MKSIENTVNGIAALSFDLFGMSKPMSLAFNIEQLNLIERAYQFDIHIEIKNKIFQKYKKLIGVLVERGMFKNLGHYKKFMLMHYFFYENMLCIFAQHKLEQSISLQRCRENLLLLKRDLEDLYIQPDCMQWPATLILNQYEALGGLYVVEGLNLFSGTIYQGVKNSFCMSQHFGARSLAGCSIEKTMYWREFLDTLDILSFSNEERKQIINGALITFEQFQHLVADLNMLD
ncbi:biliverdin-producing heme oxygenase [Acinetobacter sp. A47]|uniref:biliverdin-producing heme oxygenase n=1 Tax=Acinetobacter sp. A47 TaxID=1561217 RepID=UPI0013793865|nr:biliverdin-producing heme oxygenase [Acinetobacter sp. A47]